MICSIKVTDPLPNQKFDTTIDTDDMVSNVVTSGLSVLIVGAISAGIGGINKDKKKNAPHPSVKENGNINKVIKNDINSEIGHSERV